MTLKEKIELSQTLKTRKKFESPKAIALIDTSALSFSKIFINDSLLQDSIRKNTAVFYKTNGYKTRWLYSENHTGLFKSYLDILKNAEDFGLNPETYRYRELYYAAKLLYAHPADNESITILDKEITASFMLFAHHLLHGRIHAPGLKNKIWEQYDSDRNEVDILLKVSDTEDLEKVVETFHPHSPTYDRMRNKLEYLNTLPDDSIPQFEFGEELKHFKSGYKNNKVALLRKNLAKYGFTTSPKDENTVDEELMQKIAAFQESKEITPDGIPGKRTLYYLNMTRRRQRELLVLNMERMRWMNKNFKKNAIIVNIPHFKLYLLKEGELKLSMNVIVGKEYSPTPIFSEELAYIEFRPTWTVPQSILRHEMLPKLEKDAAYYTKRGYSVYENDKKIDPSTINWKDASAKKRVFHFVEQPSKKNSLGLVKFIMPNNMSIYLHDTPSGHLFKKEYRALSHGCVRVEKPTELAACLLEGQDDWNLEKVRQAMLSGKNRNRVYLNKKFLVQLIYITTWVNENNEIVIMNDIYGFDDHHLEILRKYDTGKNI